jgi:steroid 5-alpha reductase family enzyme
MSAWLILLFALIGLCALFAGLFFVCRRLDNYGFVDAAWSYAFTPLVWFYGAIGPGWQPRRLAIAVMVTLWSTRLGTHLLRRLVSHHPTEDGRYRQLRRDWAGHFEPKMAGFFQLQAGSIVLLGVAFLLPTLNGAPGWNAWEFAGIGLWAVALAGETLSDAQLAAFRRKASNKGRVCDVGLWRTSRHPNYFFEWLGWVAYFLFALGSPWGWLAIIEPGSILFLLLRVTGIPLTEEQSVRSKGEAYRRYQAVTSAFVPWFPKKRP